MGVKVAVTRVALNTSTGNQNITTTDLGGLTPKAALFIVTKASVDGTVTADAMIGVGAIDGTNERAISFYSDDALGSSDTEAFSGSYAFSVNDATATTIIRATFSSWITNGVTVNITVTDGTAYLLTVIFFAGTDVSAYVGSHVWDTSGSPVDVTSVGFEADLIITFSADSGFGFGFVHNDRASGITQRAWLMRDRSGRNTTEVYGSIYNSYGAACAVGAFAADGNVKVSFSSFDSSGFTMTPSAALATGMNYFALRFGTTPAVDGKVYTLATPTSTGSANDTGAGFTPQFVLYIGNLHEAFNTYNSTTLGGSVGLHAITSTAQYTNSVASEDGQGDSDTQSYSDNTAIWQSLDSGVEAFAATFTEFISTGVTLNWSNVEANAKQFLALAIEAEAGGGVVVEPAPASAVGATVNPAVVLSSISVSVSAVNAVGNKVDPVVVQGSILIVPAIVTAVVSTASPGIVLGSISVTLSTVSAIGATFGADVVLGSLVLDAGATIAVVATVDPTVEISSGSITVTPDPVSAVGAVVAPVVVQASLSITPTPVSSVADTVAPAIVQASLSVAPAAVTVVVTIVNPAVIQSSLSITPAVGDAVVTTVDPTVSIGGGGTTVAPDPVSAVGATVNPVVELGSLAVSPGAITAIGTTITPTVHLSSVAVTPAVVSAVGAVGQPGVEFGSVVIVPAQAAVVVDTVNPNVELGDIAVVPGSVGAVVTVSGPAVQLGSVAIEPAVSFAIVNTIDPTVLIEDNDIIIDLDGSPATAYTSVTNPLIIFGSIAVVPAPATVRVETRRPIVLDGTEGQVRQTMFDYILHRRLRL